MFPLKRRFIHNSSLKHIWDVQIKFLGIWFPTTEWFVANAGETSEELTKRYREECGDTIKHCHYKTTIKEML